MDITKIKLEDITIANAINMGVGTINVNKSKKGTLSDRLEAMISYRKAKCPACVEEGSCLTCGCTIDSMMAAPNKKCPDGKWNAEEQSSVVINKGRVINITEPQVIIYEELLQGFTIKDIEMSCSCVKVIDYDNTMRLELLMDFDIFNKYSYKDVVVTVVNGDDTYYKRFKIVRV
jgi:hypothetical protein